MQNISISQLQPEQRPDEKFLNFGAGALTDSELLAIILRTGTKEESCTVLADRILSRGEESAKSLLNLFEYETEDLMKIKGIGKVKALKIRAVIELSKRIAMTSAAEKLSFNNPEAIAGYYMEQMRHSKKEQVLMLMLDSACHLIRDTVISLGTVNCALFSPREIFLEAVKNEAVNIILLHNHPSGDPTPSSNDKKATKRLKSAGDLIGIELLDHIIVGDRSYVSMKEEELL